MTKLKNTKKGMAKKALSISLVAAMLATSNVPVWAAEDLFSDGGAAVEAEAPVDDADVFSSEEAPAADDVAPAAVVEEEEFNDVATYAATADYNFDDVKIEKDITWDFQGTSILTGTIKDASGNAITTGDNIKFKWILDGVELGYEKDAAYLADNTKSFSVDKENIGKTLEVRFYNSATPDITVNRISLGTIQAKKIENKDVTITGLTNYQYLGKYIEKVPSVTAESNTDLTGISEADFNWNHSGTNGYNVGTVTVTGTLTDAAAEKFGYEGSITTKYQIIPRTTLAIGNVDCTVLNSAAGEFTGTTIKMPADSVSVKLKGTNEAIPVKEAYTTKVDVKDNADNVVAITVDVDALNASDNYKLPSTSTIKFTTTDKATIATRDLSQETASLNVTYAVGDIKNENSVVAKRVNILGVDGKIISASTLGNNITIKVLGNIKDYQTAGTYKNAVEIKAANVPSDTSKANVIGTTYADLVIADQSFKDEAKFLGTVGKNLTTDPATTTATMPYTGEPVEFTKDELGKFSPDGASTTAADQKGFSITYNNNTDASTSSSLASLTVTGNPGTDYAGCSKTYYFKISPATITASNIAANNTVSTAVTSTVKGVALNEAAANAADYKEAIGLTIKAKNSATPAKSFDLAEGTDYTCEYSYVKANGTDLTADEDKNVAGNAVKVVTTLSNKNFTVTGGATINGVAISTNATKGTITAIVPIVKKAISNAEITLDKDSFVYTGKSIIPVVTVKADGKTLKEGTDYKVSVRGGINAGTSTVIITTLSGSDYQAGTQLTKDFTITKAKAEDVVVEVTTSNIKYDGKSWDGTRVNYTAKLNGVEVSSQFKTTWGENIDAGKTAGKLTLTPTTAGSNNFEGIKEATFEIKGEKLTGNIKIYNENGRDVTQDTLKAVYSYTGMPITFDDVRFINTTAGKKPVKGKDYDIIYVNNTDAGIASVCVIGKGNYVGDDANTIKDEDGKIIQDNIIVKADFTIKGLSFRAKDITVKNGVYASGLVVKPVVTVVSNGKTLVEGVDFELVYDTSKAINATTEANIKLTIKGIHGYNGVVVDKTTSGEYFSFGIDKFNLENATVVSDGKTVTVRNGNVIVPAEEYTYEIKDGKVTVTATEGNKNYEGTITTDVNKEDTFVGTPEIKDVQVVGNKATVVLAGDCENATGYDYVISKSNVFSDKASRVAVNANVLSTQTTFRYVDQDVYFAYLHAWKRGADGKKIFSKWSNAYPFSVSAITPDQPTVTSVKVTGKTVKVTYTKSANATGYDLVLGSKVKKVYGEKRPVEYGKLVKKVYNGNTVTATFTNVPKGTYYAGLHAYNRTSENRGKVFSAWSNTRKAVVK